MIMRSVEVIVAIGILIAGIIVTGCVSSPQSANTVGILYTSGTGPMPTLLATNQIDGYIAWQPFVEVAPVAGIGKVVSYSQNFPPDDRWKNHPCCVVTARDDLVAQHPELVNTLTAALILSTDYIRNHPDEAADIVADWLAGKGNFTYGNISVSSVEVLNRAIPTVGFVNNPSEQWMAGNLEFVYALRELNTLTGSLKNSTDNETKSLLFNTGPYYQAQMMITNGSIPVPPKVTGQIGVGYLMSDHHAALFMAVKKWDYFNSTYGIALKPQDLTKTRPDIVDLIVKGQKVAELKLIPADAGPQLMQLAATNTIQFALVGNPPAISAIDKGTPIKILMAANTEGSGLVVTENAPVTGWDSFVTWAKQRAASGTPVKIAAPGKGSIQDVMLRYSFEESGLQVIEVQ